MIPKILNTGILDMNKVNELSVVQGASIRNTKIMDKNKPRHNVKILIILHTIILQLHESKKS
jgi:hypothetical protein